jgi:hypothetical protein
MNTIETRETPMRRPNRQLPRCLLLLAAAAVLPAAPARAQVPQTVGFHARVLDADGQARSGLVTMTFALHSAAEGGSGLWTEDQDVAFLDGFLSVILGAVTPIPPGALLGDRYLQIAIGAEVLGPRMHVGAAPFALLAGSTAHLEGVDSVATPTQLANADFRNRVRNSGFETWSGGLPTAWTATGNAGGNTVSPSPQTFEGTYSARLMDVNNQALVIKQAVFPALPEALRGLPFTLSMHVRQVDTEASAGYVGVQFKTSETAPSTKVDLPSGSSAADWTQVRLSGTLPGDADTLVVWIAPLPRASDTGAYDVDAVMLAVGTDLFPAYRPTLDEQVEIGRAHV